jgi:RNA polymerase sigma-70 factor, ECF subfamily
MDSAQSNRRKKPDGKPAKVNRKGQVMLGQQLHAMYDGLINHGVPDRFSELLNRMDKAILGAVPSLRAFAISLCGNADLADDLVQETLLRALANNDSFQPGTNISPWLFTILRSHFRSENRKHRREVDGAAGHCAESLKSQPDQLGQVEFREIREALSQLPADQREALVLVGASGFSYEVAANICGCAVGTIKSRVNRARTRLAELMDIDDIDEFGPDQQTRAVLASEE